MRNASMTEHITMSPPEENMRSLLAYTGLSHRYYYRVTLAVLNMGHFLLFGCFASCWYAQRGN